MNYIIVYTFIHQKLISTDIQLCDSPIVYSVIIFCYLAVISKIVSCAEISILDVTFE